MDKPLRILNVEDSELDSTVLKRHLLAAGYDIWLKRVRSMEEMKAALVAEAWDVIISDHKLPGLTALDALATIHKLELDIPLIIISETVEEEIVVKALLSGAGDYIPKSNLSRLIPAIQREIVQVESNRAKRKAEEALRSSEAELHALFAAMNDVILVFDYDGRHLKVAPTNPEHFFTKGTNRIGKTVHDIYPPLLADFMLANIQMCLDASRTLNVEYSFAIDGTDRWFDGTVTPMTVDSVVWVARDITKRKQAEDDLRESEQRFAGAFEFAPIGVALVLPDGNWLKLNRAMCELLGYSEAELLNLTFREITYPDDLEEDVRNRNLLLSGEIPHFQIEKRYMHRQGHAVFVRLHATLARYENGDPRYFILQIQDITDRKADEHQLQLHSLILQSIGQAVIVTDSTGSITYWNNSAEKIYGWCATEVLGRNIVDVTPTTTTREQGLEILEALKQGESWSGEFEVRDRDGNSFPIFVTNTPLLNAEGEVESIIGVSVNVTERKNSEEKLRESEALLSSTQRIARIGSWVLDLTETDDANRKERWSDEHYRIYGFEPGQVETTSEVFYNAVHQDDRKRVANAVDKAIEEAKPFDIEHRILLPDGHERIVHAMAEVVLDDQTRKPVKLIGSVQDITERRLAEAALRESDEKFHHLADNITDAFWIRSPDMSQIHYISPAYEKIWGRTLRSDYANPHEWYDFILPNDRQRVKEAYAGLMRDVPNIEVEYRIVRPDGEMRWVRARGFQVRDDDGRLIRLAGVVTDITERKRNIEAVGESEKRYRSVVETAPDVIVTIDDQSTICFINPAAERVFGYTVDELKGSSLTMLMPQYLRSLHEAGLRSLM